jgi:hypothetical protein
MLKFIDHIVIRLRKNRKRHYTDILKQKKKILSLSRIVAKYILLLLMISELILLFF